MCPDCLAPTLVPDLFQRPYMLLAIPKSGDAYHYIHNGLGAKPGERGAAYVSHVLPADPEHVDNAGPLLRGPKYRPFWLDRLPPRLYDKRRHACTLTTE